MKFLILTILVLTGFVFPGSQEEITEGKRLIDSNINCNEISDEQLEAIGEYYMEQMHPGQAHEFMDERMGGEGSQSLKQAHIQMAQIIYCNKTDTPITYGAMMGMMPMMGRFMGGGIMNWNMGYSSNMMYGLGIYDILILILLVGLIILVYLHIFNKLKETKKR